MLTAHSTILLRIHSYEYMHVRLVNHTFKLTFITSSKDFSSMLSRKLPLVIPAQLTAIEGTCKQFYASKINECLNVSEPIQNNQ